MICTTTNTISIPVGEMYLHGRMFCALAHASSFYMQEHFFTLADTTCIQMLLRLLFPWVQCQSLKPVLSQCSQMGFVTVYDLIALYTNSYVFYSHGCNKFLHARTFFTLANTIAQIFKVLSKVWPCANRARVTNNCIFELIFCNKKILVFSIFFKLIILILHKIIFSIRNNFY